MSDDKVEIEQITEPFEMGNKRFHAPFIVRGTCQTCGYSVELDFTEGDYFAFPTLGKPITLEFYCQSCDGGTPVTLKLGMTLEVVGEEG